MDFLKKWFGGGSRQTDDPVDPGGIYLYFRSHHAPEAVTRVRIDKQYELNSTDGGYVWHKTIVDSKYFSRIQAIVYFDRSYSVQRAELDGGELITRDEYEAALAGPDPAGDEPAA